MTDAEKFYERNKSCVSCMGDIDLCDCPKGWSLTLLDCYDPIEEDTLP